LILYYFDFIVTTVTVMAVAIAKILFFYYPAHRAPLQELEGELFCVNPDKSASSACKRNQKLLPNIPQN
jgi:hypothetical protein